MICPECKIEKGCNCNFVKSDLRAYEVCPECKKNLDLQSNGIQPKIKQPNVQGV